MALLLIGPTRVHHNVLDIEKSCRSDKAQPPSNTGCDCVGVHSVIGIRAVFTRMVFVSTVQAAYPVTAGPAGARTTPYRRTPQAFSGVVDGIGGILREQSGPCGQTNTTGICADRSSRFLIITSPVTILVLAVNFLNGHPDGGCRGSRRQNSRRGWCPSGQIEAGLRQIVAWREWV